LGWKIKVDCPNGNYIHGKKTYKTIELAQDAAEKATLGSWWGGVWYAISESFREKKINTYDLRGIEGTIKWL
jgi:hypothetical protein